MPRKYNVAVLPGDGIGLEVVGEAVRVLMACEEAVPGVKLSLESYDAGARYWLKSGKKAERAPGAFEACRKADNVLLGAIGLGFMWLLF